jgi:DNA helicase-2/ATP-dependent DNA helicase PcrA
MSREYVVRPFREALHLQIDYAGQLNEQQLAAVTAPPGPALVIAGAGSGKTRALTYRVAYLLEQGIAPERILLLTFTNKAAREMMRRVTDLLGQELSSLWGGTFHAVGNRILRLHAQRLGYGRDFTILDRDDAKQLLAACLEGAGADTKEGGFPKADVLADIFSLAVNTGREVADVLDERYDYFTPLASDLATLSELYTVRKRAANVMDFDDLLALWLQLLRQEPEVGQHYQQRFQFILVDEYQDTNRLQGEVIDLLAARHHNVMVVGDDAQSIYSWRGANLQNILTFPERYPETATYKIEANYRSTPEILNVANAAIRANRGQFAKQLAPVRRPGLKPALVPCEDAFQQAAFVARRVEELSDEGVSLRRMAVLYRSHFHALELQLELTRRRIPFTITSGIRFFEQAHVKDIAAFLKLIANPRDEPAFIRLALLLPGIGAKSAARLWRAYREAGLGENGQAAAPRSIAASLQACAASVPKKAAVAWAQHVATISQLEEAARASAPPGDMLGLVLEAGYEDYLKQTYANYRSRREDLEQLTVFARQFSSLEEFLSQLALLTNLEAEEDRPAASDDDQLRLSTIHQAKGLEFDVVFIIMLCEGLFPSRHSLETPEDEEEERRLMYVAITRARDELYLSYPIVRGGGKGEFGVVQRISRFVQEIPPELLDEWRLRAF